jgi:hypothetical protein
MSQFKNRAAGELALEDFSQKDRKGAKHFFYLIYIPCRYLLGLLGG